MKKSLLLFVVVAATLLIQGCAAKDESVAHGDAAGKTITIATGDFFEACDKWAPGETVNFSFTSSQPVMFNVHYHEKHAEMYAIKDVLVDEFGGSFVVQSDAIHCCLWQNNNPKFVTLTYNMEVEKQ